MNPTLSRHPISAAYGDFSPREFQELKDNIEAEGVRDAIIIFEGMILDGWHRYKASTELLMLAPLIYFEGSLQEAGDLVRSKHTRRNLSAEGRALAIAKVYEYCAARPGRPSNSAKAAEFPTASAMAHEAGVSVRSMHRANTVLRRGIPALHDAVQRGQVKIAAAAEIARLAQCDQTAALEQRMLGRRKPFKSGTFRRILTSKDIGQPALNQGFEASRTSTEKHARLQAEITAEMRLHHRTLQARGSKAIKDAVGDGMLSARAASQLCAMDKAKQDLLLERILRIRAERLKQRDPLWAQKKAVAMLCRRRDSDHARFVAGVPALSTFVLTMGRRVTETGSAELLKAVRAGAIPLLVAAALAKLPQQDQRDALLASPAYHPVTKRKPWLGRHGNGY